MTNQWTWRYVAADGRELAPHDIGNNDAGNNGTANNDTANNDTGNNGTANNDTAENVAAQGVDPGTTVISVPEHFPLQADAESWIGEHWRGLVDAGVDAVYLREGDVEVYGPMSLRPAE